MGSMHFLFISSMFFAEIPKDIVWLIGIGSYGVELWVEYVA